MKLVSNSLDEFLVESTKTFRRGRDPKTSMDIGARAKIAKDIIPLIDSDVLEDIENLGDTYYRAQLKEEKPEYLDFLDKVIWFLEDKAFFGPYFEPGRESKRKMIEYVNKNADGRYVYDGLYGGGQRKGKDGWIPVFSTIELPACRKLDLSLPESRIGESVSFERVKDPKYSMQIGDHFNS